MDQPKASPIIVVFQATLLLTLKELTLQLNKYSNGFMAMEFNDLTTFTTILKKQMIKR